MQSPHVNGPEQGSIDAPTIFAGRNADISRIDNLRFFEQRAVLAPITPIRDDLIVQIHLAQRALHTMRPFLEKLGEQLIKVMPQRNFSSIVSDDLSGRYVARFVRDLLLPDANLPLIPVWPRHPSKEGCVAGNAEEVFSRHQNKLGDNPLVVTESIMTGVTIANIVKVLAQMGKTPGVASLVISEGRGVNYHEASKKIHRAGAQDIVHGGYMNVWAQHDLAGLAVLSGMQKKGQSELSHAVSWASLGSSVEEIEQRRLLVKLVRHEIASFAHAIRARA